MPCVPPPIATLREVVETLAPLDRTPCSPGEAEAAQWLAERLKAAGCTVTVEEAAAVDNYARHIAPLCASGLLAAAAGAAGARKTSVLLGLSAAALIADDASNGLRPWRRASRTAKPTQNVVADIGNPEASRTVVVLAHHDAAPTGHIFDPSAHIWFATRFPGVIERVNTSLPVWWPVAGGPALVALGALTRRRSLIGWGAAFAAGATLAMADIHRSPTVPGANDNLSAVAVLVALAEALRERPVEDVRVLLVSCGAEEVLQGGIHDFAARWFPGLDRDSTWFLNLDTVGSPHLVLLEGEGTFFMEDYTRPQFRDRIASCARDLDIRLQRGMRGRASTDAVVPSRAGYPTATLVSLDQHKALSNYHLMSDTPENLDYATVARAAQLSESVVRAIARGEPA